ncbi:MAG TPA: peptidoglycan recognition family protein [Phycisphaerales bacterium]|nr:peptidoglycan recognition family protein [Phycisphaerales bacterium]
MAKVSKSSRKVRSREESTRIVVVWMALFAAMTVVGGGLWLAQGGKLADVQPLMATSTMTSGATASGIAPANPSALEPIFRTGQPIQSGRWQAIVIHDTGQLVGTPASLDERARGMGLRSLGYHFVVGNGNGMDDGELFVSSRWMNQDAGAHTAGDNADWFNRQAIGICLVGDGDRQRFSAQQIRRATQLAQLLAQRLGIPADRVYLHSQIAPTTSPGRFFPEREFRAGLSGR